MRQAREKAGFELKRLKRPGQHAVGGVAGLRLHVKPSGAKSWVLRVVVGDRRREFGLGGYPTVTLEQARERAREARELIEHGTDPSAAKREARDTLRAADARRITFDDAAKAYLRAKSREFRNAKHTAQWTATLDTYASPVIGTLPVADVELAHVMRILEPLWTVKTETASRLRGRIEQVLAWATVSGFRAGENPARWKGNLDQVLPKATKVRRVQHHAALPWQDVGAFMVELRKRDGMAARALSFAILTAARSGEVRGATWDEIDLRAKVWTIDGERMKTRRPHRVPLSEPALELLRSLPRMTDTRLVFPAPRGAQLSDMTLTAVLRRMGKSVTAHGFRSAFKDWARSETKFADEVTELALAHVNSDATRAAYARDELLALRTRLMTDWARYCAKVRKPASVTRIGRARA